MKALLASRHFYLMCALPALGSFRSTPPLSKQGLLALVTESEGPVQIVHTVLLCDDLLQREAILADEIEPDQAEMSVLLPLPSGEEPLLPYFLMPDHDEDDISSDRMRVDMLWHRYFRHAVKIARRTRSHFLETWVGYEVGLRNAMALKRAQALGIDPVMYLVAPELTHQDMDFNTPLAEWSAASNPLDALETFDRARWGWLTENEPWYRFSDDEVAAYTAKLMLLHRWHRISKV